VSFELVDGARDGEPRRSLSTCMAWTRRLALSVVLSSVLVGGCGFKLAGPAEMPFESLYVAAPDYSSFGAQFKRYVGSGGKTRLASRPEDAQAVLEILSETREKQILSLTAAGTVAEYLLRYRVSFRLRDSGNRDWIPPSEIALQRDLTYDDDVALAKENEEQFLYEDMKNDAIDQLLRRLATAQVPA
jgi:LPS-assembly lipoprotein